MFLIFRSLVLRYPIFGPLIWRYPSTGPLIGWMVSKVKDRSSTQKVKVWVILYAYLSHTLPLTSTPNGLDQSGLSTSHTRIAWADLESANIINIFLNISGDLASHLWRRESGVGRGGREVPRRGSTCSVVALDPTTAHLSCEKRRKAHLKSAQHSGENVPTSCLLPDKVSAWFML